MKPAVITPDCSAFLTDVKSRIQSARLAADRPVYLDLVPRDRGIARPVACAYETNRLAGSANPLVPFRWALHHLRTSSSRHVWFPQPRACPPQIAAGLAGGVLLTKCIVARQFRRHLNSTRSHCSD